MSSLQSSQLLEATRTSDRRTFREVEYQCPAESRKTLQQMQDLIMFGWFGSVCSVSAPYKFLAKLLSKVKLQPACYKVIAICTNCQQQT